MTNTSNWTECQTGEIVGLKRQHQRRQLVSVAGKTVAAFALFACVGFSLWHWQVERQTRELQYFGLTCADVRELLPEYKAQKLDERRSELLRKHVARCEQCASLRSQVFGEQAAIGGIGIFGGLVSLWGMQGRRVRRRDNL